MNEITKVCTKCGEAKSLSEYHAAKKGKYGRVATCKVCKQQWAKSNRLDNIDVLRDKEAVFRKNNKTLLRKQAEARRVRNAVSVVSGDFDGVKKSCTGCGEMKVLSEFNSHSGGKYGVDSTCKICAADRWSNRSEKYRANLLARRKELYASNPEPHRQRAVDFRKNNSEKVASGYRNWCAVNKGKLACYRMTREVSKLQRTPMWSEFEKIQKVYMKAAELSKQWGELVHVDHIIPLRGDLVSGLHVWENLQLLTQRENNKKYNKFSEELNPDGWLYPM